LEFVAGCGIRDLAPNLREADIPKDREGGYMIVGVNSARSAEAMAEELSDPPEVVFLDLWNAKYGEGMSVMLQDLSAGYCNDNNVLHNISVDIQPRAKVGFVGKTGCGKSTALLCCLRILEPRSGRIDIGDIDAKKMGLKTLRSLVGLVPQDPTVFQGTVRYNVDPFDQFPDSCVRSALEAVQFMQFVQEDGLDTEVARDGVNLSLGQRQLLSLARMVIKQPPVLLLDECTSALDPSTQEAVQRTLMTHFPMTTIIAVAHRVETILDFDHIVAFSRGSVAESGGVEDLLNIEGGIFAGLVKASRQDLRRCE
jgi:ABC-type multidrug transport system fused ATPase/permease subunit